MSTERRVRPERLLKGCGAHSSPMPCAVLSVYSGVSSRKGATPASHLHELSTPPYDSHHHMTPG